MIFWLPEKGRLPTLGQFDGGGIDFGPFDASWNPNDYNNAWPQGGGLPTGVTDIINGGLSILDKVLRFRSGQKDPPGCTTEACSNTVNAFYDGANDWLHPFLNWIPTVCSADVPDSKVWSVYDTTCSNFRFVMSQLAGRCNSDHCRKGLTERPCYGGWNVKGDPGIPAPDAQVQQALSQRANLEASGQLKCAAGAPGEWIPGIPNSYLAIAGAILGIVLLKRFWVG